MFPQMKEALQRTVSQNVLFIAGAIAGVLLVAGFLGYGTLLATLPGLVVVTLLGSLLLWVSTAGE